MLAPTLYQFFRRQILNGFGRRGLAEPATVDYVSDILTRFSQTAELYPFRDEQEKPLEHLVDLFAVRRHAQGHEDGAINRPLERKVLLHIGEYSLFMSGLFRRRLVSRGQLNYYIANGSSAFWLSATHARQGSAHQRLLQQLYYNFTHITNALDSIRADGFCAQPGVPIQPATALWRM